MPMREISAEELRNLDHIGFSILQFHATWCGPCKMLKVELDKMVAENETINVLRYDIDEDIDLARSFGIKGVPALFILKEDQVIGPKSGFFPKSHIEEWVHATLEWEGK
jgi:thioredoxin 1